MFVFPLEDLSVESQSDCIHKILKLDQDLFTLGCFIRTDYQDYIWMEIIHD